MSLARKLTVKIAVLIAGLVVVGAVSLWGLMGLSQHFDVAEDEYRQLRAIYEVGHRAALAKTLIRLDGADVHEIREQLRIALFKVDGLLAASPPGGLVLSDRYQPTLASMQGHLNEAYRCISHSSDHREVLIGINNSLGGVAKLAGEIRGDIVSNRQNANARYRYTVKIVAALASVIVLTAVFVGISQYRTVMRPLRQLEQGVKQVADGNFAQHLPVTGDREFAQLSQQFNEMAVQLDMLYRRLDEQIKTKSQQLVRSQRLASVGFLAAGLAHEINNPLGIIAGHAEAALGRLDRENSIDNSLQKIAGTLHIVCEEAFRCKDITAKLLSLSSPNADERSSVCLMEVAQRVGKMLNDLPRFGGIRLTLDDCVFEDTLVHASEGQITQVMVNLIANAFEAVHKESGEVKVRISRTGPWVTLSVEDNGRGMTEEVSKKIFEPFFTDKPQRGQRGIGLGLSVTHAIVEQHGGHIDACSGGPGKGSIFTVELLALSTAEVPLHA